MKNRTSYNTRFTSVGRAKNTPVLHSGLLLVIMLLSIAGCGERNENYAPQPSAEDLHWYEQPLRILQTVLREPDGANYDVGNVIRYMNETGSNVLVVNAGGIIDFFQNSLPAANVNQFIGNRDLLRDIIDSCHMHDIRVIARVDFRGVTDSVYQHHPDWFAKNHDGSSMRLSWSGNLHHACYNGYYKNEHAIAFLEQLFEDYQPDGIWHNAVGSYGICHCEACRRRYMDETGKQLPVEEEATGEELQEYLVQKEKWANEHIQKMRSIVKSYGPEKAYVAEIFGMYEEGAYKHTGVDLYAAVRNFDFMISSSFLNPNKNGFSYRDLFYPQSIVKFMKSLRPDAEAVILFGGNGTAHRYVSEPASDTRIWLWEALAAGGRFWNCYFTGQQPGVAYDARNAYLERDAYTHAARFSNLLASQLPEGEIAIFYSKASRNHTWDDEPEKDLFGTPMRGVERVLQQNHYQYRFISDFDFSSSSLDRTRLLILPNVECLSAEQAGIIREYVKSGGKLMASYRTSLLDPQGKERENFALADVFGVDYAGRDVVTNRDCYQYINNRGFFGDTFRGTSLLMNWGNTLLCDTTTGRVLCSYIPFIDNQPPETAWRDHFEGDDPTMVLNRFGQGEAIYFSNTPFYASAIGGDDDFEKLVCQSIDHLLDNHRLITTDAPSAVHLGLTRAASDDYYILSLVNTASAPTRPVKEILPVQDITVDVNAEGFLASELFGDISVDTDLEGRLTITIPVLNEFASILLYRKPSE